MFVGHYAGAFLARAYDKRLPLGAAFVAAQLVDLGWDALILAGVERARIVPGLPSNPLDLYFMPYTHSLAATVVWAAAAFGVVKGARLFGGSTKVALATAAAVASHWSWNWSFTAEPPLARRLVPEARARAVEPPCGRAGDRDRGAGRLGGDLRPHDRREPALDRRVRRFLAVIQVATVLGPLPPTMSAISASLFVAYLALAWAARAVERRASRASG